MNVLYTCDNNYVWLMGISTISLFENNKHLESLTVYLLGENISKENRRRLKEISLNYGREIVIIDVPKLDIPDALVSSRWPQSAFTRLFSGELLPQNMNRIMYLDCDTIVMGNIEKLEFINMSDKVFFGVRDCIGRTYKKNIGIQGDATYINAGVLLINLEQLRKFDLNSSIEDYMNKYMRLINYADQDILNGVFERRIGILEAKYDVMTIDVVHSYEEIKILRHPTAFYSKQELSEAVRNPVIIHYTTNMTIVRPWFSNSNHPLKDEFRHYMSISPWCNKKLNKMVFDSKEAKIISIIQKLPTRVANRILGLIHAELKPIYIRVANKLNFLRGGGTT